MNGNLSITAFHTSALRLLSLRMCPGAWMSETK